MNDWIGRTLGRVRVESLIARGGMAEVYLGMHTTLDRDVAVKIMRNQYEDDEDLLERFQREAKVVAKLRHQNIVQVFDYDVIDERPFIVMEYVKGPSLSKYLSVLHKSGKRLDLNGINRILAGVAHALQYAHESGVVHRDIKPGNIILTSRSKEIIPGEPLPEDFEPVLTDFGLVRFLNSSRQTSAGQTAGTPAYMSPEQARGETTDGRTDIYSLGIVLYEMLAGRPPFDGETTMSVLLKHITDPPLPIHGLSNAMQRVLDKALAKDKAERFQKPNDFARAFDVVASEETEQSTFMGLASVDELRLPVAVSRPVSAPIVAEPVDSLIMVRAPIVKKSRRWLPLTLSAAALALFGVIFYTTNSFTATPLTETPAPTETLPIPTTQRPFIPLSGALGSTAILHFRDGDMVIDQTMLEALALPAPPEGSQYEVWLGNAEARVSMGMLSVDSSGKGLLTYNAEDNENFLALYDHVELTVKINDVDQVAYAYTLPSDGLVYLRQLLVSAPDAPNQSALIQILESDSLALEESTKGMMNAYSNSDQTSILRNAEIIMNILEGSKSPDYKDWNGDTKINDTGSGYGFLLNGNNLGHIQAVYAHADYAANSPGASQNMIIHGAEVKLCAENLIEWIPLLKEQTQKILSTNTLEDMETPVKTVVTLVEQINTGVDLDGNGSIDLIAGECGVTGLYKAAYDMADMPLLPVNIFGTPTAVTSGTPSPVGTIFHVTVTPTRGSGGGGAVNTPIPNNGGGNNAGGNGNGNAGGNGGGNGGGNAGGNGGGNGGGNNNNP